MANVTSILSKVRGTTEDQNLLSYLNNYFSNCQKNRLQFEKQWYTNIAFYFGRQWIEWSTSWSGSTSRMFEPVTVPWRARPVINRIRMHTRKEISKITSQDPTGFVLPASGDDGDLAAARAGENIIEHEWRELKVRRELRRAAWWQVITGTGFVKDWFDESAIVDIGVPGSIQVESVPTFNLFVPDLLQEEIERQECVFHAVSKTPEWVEQKFGVKPKSEGRSSEGGFEDKFMQAMGLNQENPKSVCYVKEGWFKPGGKFPNGAVIIWCGDEILYKADQWPLRHIEYPFTKLEHIPTGRFYGESAITDMIPLQKEYNKSRGQIHEAKNRTAMPQMIAQKGSIEQKKVTSEPGLIIEYRGGMQPPKMENPPTIPAYMINELDRIKGDMDDISSQHEVSRGQTPPNVEAATAISFLQEQDDSALSNSIASMEEAVEKIGKHILGHVDLHWDQERIVRIIGYNQQFEAFSYTKESLSGTTSFYVVQGSAQPRSLAAKQAFLFEIADRQLIPPDRILRYLEMPDSARLYEEMMIDTRHAQRENLKIMNGMEVTVNSWDNDTAHILEHDIYRKRQEYESADEQARVVLNNHVRDHKLRLIILNGYPPPPPEGVGPEGEPIYNDLLIDSMAYRIIMGIPIQPAGVDSSGAPVGNSEMGGQNGAVVPQ